MADHFPPTFVTPSNPGFGTADTEAPSDVNSKLAIVLSVKPGVGQNIVLHTSPSDKKFPSLIFAFLIYSIFCFVLQILSKCKACHNSQSDFLLAMF